MKLQLLDQARITTLLVFFSFATVLHGQSTIGGTPYSFAALPHTPKDQTVLPSPEPTQLNRYSDYPVSYCTGVPDINVPLYAFREGDLAESLSLSYHASGVKVEDIAGFIGLGWSLRAGGSISRSIHGQPDEKCPFDLRTASAIEKNNDLAYLRDLQDVRKDASYDRYNYHFGPFSGSFIYDVNTRRITQLPQTDNRIELLNYTSPSSFDFKVTTPEGTSYYFTEREQASYHYAPSVITHLYHSPDYNYATTSWHLSRIVSFNKTDTIRFSYQTIPSWRRIRSYGYHSLTGTNRYITDSGYDETYSNGDLSTEHISTFHNVRIPSRIEFRDGYISFTSASITSTTPSGNPGSRISRIEVYNRTKTLLRTIELDNAASFADKRMMLSGVTVREQGNIVDRYAFTYYSPSTAVTFRSDQFGYYNGKNNALHDSPLDETGTWQDGRTYHFASARTYNLYTMTCSTGAVTTFTYEPNLHTVIASGKPVPIQIGVRIKRIEVDDPVSGTGRMREFAYENSCSNIDFTRLTKGMFVSQSGLEIFERVSGLLAGKTSLSQTNTFTGSCRLPGSSVEGAVVYYGKVTETVSESGTGECHKVVYEYDSGSFADKIAYSNYRMPMKPDPLSPQPRFMGQGTGGPSRYYWCFVPCYIDWYFQESFLPKTQLARKSVYRQQNGVFQLVEEEKNVYSVHDLLQVTTGFYLENLIYSSRNVENVYAYNFKDANDFNFFETGVLTGRSTLDTTYTVRYFPGYAPQRQVTSYEYNKYATVYIPGGLMPFPLNGTLSPSLLQTGDTLINRPGNLLPSSIKTQAGGSTYERRLYYSSSIRRPFFEAMAAAGNISAPVMEQLIINGIDTASLHTAYGKYGSAILPRQYTELHNGDTLSYRLCSYDALGNLIETSSNGLAPTSYFWGNSRACPVKAVKGIGIRQTGQWGISASSAGNLPSTAGHITALNYIPLVGLASITSPSQRKQQFEYSGTRLSGMLDGYGNPIFRYTFHYRTGSSDANYVRTMGYLAAGGNGLSDSYLYFDGLGQPYQLMQPAFTPLGNTLATQTSYDAFGREKRKWLPVPVANPTSPAPVTDLPTRASAYYGDAVPYSENQYEGSARNLLLAAEGPGASFAGHPQKTAYMTNAATQGELFCMHYRLVDGESLCRTGDYAPGDLQVVLSTDEDGNKAYTFTDQAGRTVLSRCMNGTTAHDTYVVYDNLGRQRFVLPPSASDALTALNTNWSIRSNATLKNYVYFYRYNGKSHLVEKKLPGADPVYYLYDKAGQCIFSQDGNQRSANRWEFTIPDLFGRVVLTGYYTGASPETGIRSRVVCATFDKSQAGLGSTGYTVPGIFPSGPVTVLKADYYDTYDFLEKYPDEKAGLGYAPLAGYGERFMGYPVGTSGIIQLSMTPHAGMLTGSCIALLSGDLSKKIVSAFYYDDKERVVQQLATNHLGGYEKEYCSYTFTGKPTKKLHKHSVPGKTSRTELYTYAYDRAERPLTATHQLDNNIPVVLVRNTYDETGRLSSKQCHNSNTLNSTYSYNIRSWITGISDANLTQTIVYNESGGYYNGNIRSMSWKTGSESFTRKYTYTYDGLDRLTAASYEQSNGQSGRYNASYGYNKMGSITSLRRSGLCTTQPGTYGVIDNLNMSYSGNQLRKVTDLNSREPLYNGAFHFEDGSDQPTEYYYDKNGNMTKDLNKKISRIQYNPLNLPSQVDFENGSGTDYTYDASGVKRQVKHTTLPTIDPFNPGGQAGITLLKSTTTDYCGNMVYEGGVLKSILTQQGYITLESGTPVYHYYLKDYLGNNRVVIKQGGTVEEVNHYYPYGGLFGEGISVNKQPYKFSGKELDRMHGLDWYDFSARTQDPGVPRFTTMDPLCEKYYSISPYAYCGNNPVSYIDPTGEFKTKFGAWLYKIFHGGDEILQDSGGEYFVSTQLKDNETANNEATITVERTFDWKGRHEGEDLNTRAKLDAYLAKESLREMAEQHGWEYYETDDREEAIRGLLQPFTLVTLPNPTVATPSALKPVSTFGVRSGKASSRGMPHGDNGRSLKQAEERIKELLEEMKGATVKEKGKIKKKIENIREAAQKKNKGETHWH